MRLEDILRVLRVYWRSILAVFILISGAALAYLSVQVPQYTSYATIYLLPQAQGAAGQLASAQQYAATQARTFSELARGPVVLGPVHDKLGLPGDSTSLVGKVSAAPLGDQAAILIAATDPDAQFAHDLVAATADQLLIAFKEFSAGATEVLEAKITSPASLPTAPSTPGILRNLVTAMGLAAALAVAQAFARNYFDATVETPDELARITDHRVIGEIPFTEDGESGSNLRSGGFSIKDEAYRRLRTNLQFLLLNSEKNSLIVTSSVPGEGKTQTSIALAKSLAETGSRVLLVDCDLRRPNVANQVNLPNSRGLSTLLMRVGHFQI